VGNGDHDQGDQGDQELVVRREVFDTSTARLA
jgi:hypothetical protein